MTTDEVVFLASAERMAIQAGHLYPKMAACEAALESRFGTSQLARDDNNYFGMKQHSHPIYGTHALPTREFLHDRWVTVSAKWIHYPEAWQCFKDRVMTLQRLSSVYPHYAAALLASDPVTYIKEVSKTWSTDPNRANEVIKIYKEYTGTNV